MGNCLGKKKSRGEKDQSKDTEMLREDEGVELSKVEMDTSNICDSNCTRVVHEEDPALEDIKQDFEATPCNNSHSLGEDHETVNSSSSKNSRLGMMETTSEQQGEKTINIPRGDTANLAGIDIDNEASIHDKNASKTGEILEIIPEEEETEVTIVVPSIKGADDQSYSPQGSLEDNDTFLRKSPTSLEQLHTMTVSDSSSRDTTATEYSTALGSPQRLSIQTILPLTSNPVNNHPKVAHLSPSRATVQPFSLPVTPLSLMAVDPMSLPSTPLSSQPGIYSPVYRLECDSQDSLSNENMDKLNDNSEKSLEEKCDDGQIHLEVQVVIQEDSSGVSPE